MHSLSLSVPLLVSLSASLFLSLKVHRYLLHWLVGCSLSLSPIRFHLRYGTMRGSGETEELFKEPTRGIKGMAEDLKQRRKKLEMYQSESHAMKTLFTNSAAARTDMATRDTPNPIWMTFPTKCVKPISSVDEMREKLEYFTKSDEAMVVRYHQSNCTACNAVDKVFEMLCHQSATRMPGLRFYEVNKNEVPELARGLVRFPQIKGFSGGAWTDIDFKPPAAYRDELYREVEKEVRRQMDKGTPVTALQTEEMYYSGAGPAMLEVTEEAITAFYTKAQVRLHNYWKQVSVRRTWFYRKFVEPRVDEDIKEEWRIKSVFGEKVVYGPSAPDEFAM